MSPRVKVSSTIPTAYCHFFTNGRGMRDLSLLVSPGLYANAGDYALIKYRGDNFLRRGRITVSVSSPAV